jgi:CDP-diacylglycerol--glycerol-3-phosphate 3-phosphatidyltransferase
MFPNLDGFPFCFFFGIIQSRQTQNKKEIMNSRENKEEKKESHLGYMLVQSMTLARIPLAIALLFILPSSKKAIDTAFMLSLVLLGIIELTDAIDGKIARRFRLVSEWGATLDPYADSVSRLIVYWALATKGRVLLFVPLIMALRDITVAYSRIVLAQNNRSVSAKKSGKIKASVQATGAFLALGGPLYWEAIGRWSYYALSWIIIVVTFFSAIEYVHEAVSVLKKSDWNVKV